MLPSPPSKVGDSLFQNKTPQKRIYFFFGPRSVQTIHLFPDPGHEFRLASHSLGQQQQLEAPSEGWTSSVQTHRLKLYRGYCQSGWNNVCVHITDEKRRRGHPWCLQHSRELSPYLWVLLLCLQREILLLGLFMLLCGLHEASEAPLGPCSLPLLW